SLDANDFATQTVITQSDVWVNHGTVGLGDFTTTQTTLFPTVGQFDFTRGMYFTDRQMGFLCKDACPTQLLNNCAFTVEIWQWNPTLQGTEACVGWGDRPSYVAEFDLGNNQTFVGYTDAQGSVPGGSIVPGGDVNWNAGTGTFPRTIPSSGK